MASEHRCKNGSFSWSQQQFFAADQRLTKRLKLRGGGVTPDVKMGDPYTGQAHVQRGGYGGW